MLRRWYSLWKRRGLVFVAHERPLKQRPLPFPSLETRIPTGVLFHAIPQELAQVVASGSWRTCNFGRYRSFREPTQRDLPACESGTRNVYPDNDRVVLIPHSADLGRNQDLAF